jgi:DNA-binding transcriptional MerR regulator
MRVDKAPDAFRTISEVAEDLDLPQHVLRFWETRFAQIKPMKRGGGRRYYRPEDVDVLRGIRHLLYSEGYTIRGVQRIFKDHGVKFVQTVWQAGAPQPTKAPSDGEEPESHAEVEPAEPRRRLFGILPLLPEGEREAPAESDISEPAEPPLENGSREISARSAGAPAAVPARTEGRRLSAAHEAAPGAPREPGLARDAVRKLQTTLAELSECRRLLEAVLQEKTNA